MATTGVNAVERALVIIESFRGSSDRLSLQTVADKTSLNKATIIRLIASLENFGYVLRVHQGSMLSAQRS